MDMNKYCQFNKTWLIKEKEKEKISQRPRREKKYWSNHLEKK